MQKKNDFLTRRFWSRFSIHAFAVIGVIALVLDVWNEAFPEAELVGGWLLLLGIVLTAGIVGLVRSWPKPIEVSFSAPRTAIRVVEGDLFDEPGHVVIGTCDTFDTETPSIIAKGSLQGQALERFYGGDVKELDRQILHALGGRNPSARIDKPGKQEKFGVGTVAALKQSGRYLFLLAYSEMNEKNEARSTADALWSSLSSLWQEVSVHGNGTSVSIPVIGGGMSRMSQILPAQDSIRFIALSFMMASRKERVCDELRIIVRQSDYAKLDRLELQAFLSSLRSS
jgi:hypothetical protein